MVVRALLIGMTILLSACGGGESANRKIMERISANPDYRDIVRKEHADIWAGLSDEEALAKVEEVGLHSGYLAFVQIYPDSPLTAQARQKMDRAFRGVIAEKTIVFSANDLRAMCWGTRGNVFKWSKSVAAGFEMATGKRFGALAIDTEYGLIQLVVGDYRNVDSGVELSAGSAIIYPAKCNSA